MDVFVEAELKLIKVSKIRRNKNNIACKKLLEEALEIIAPGSKTNNNSDMNFTITLHPTHHSKDMSRIKSQTKFNTICQRIMP